MRMQRARAVTTALAGGSVIGVLVLADLAAHSAPARASAVPSTPTFAPTGGPGSTPAAAGVTQPAAADPTTSPTTAAPAPTTAPASTPVSSAPASSPATSSPYIQSGNGSSGYSTYAPPVPSYSPTPVQSGAS